MTVFCTKTEKNTNINTEMFRYIYACSYKYSKDKYYIKLQKKEKAKKKKLWKDKNAVDPWLWRKETQYKFHDK